MGKDPQQRMYDGGDDGPSRTSSQRVPGRSSVRVNGPTQKTDLDRKLDAERRARLSGLSGQSDEDLDDKLAAARATQLSGNKYLDEGAVCDNEEDEDCFLDAHQRTKIVTDFKIRLTEAATHFKIAATQVQLEELLKKPEDLGPIAQILFDFASSFIGGKITAALLGLKSGNVAKLTEVVGAEGDSRKGRRAAQLLGALQGVSDDAIKATSGAFWKSASAVASASLKASQGGKDDKSETTSFLGLIVTQTSLAFSKLRETLPSEASDAELLVAWGSFDPELHLIEKYKEELAAKLARYWDSGIVHIHTKEEGGHTGSQASGNVGHARGTYVVWNTYVSGYPPKLVYNHDGRNAFDKNKRGQYIAEPDGEGGYVSYDGKAAPTHGRGGGVPGISPTGVTRRGRGYENYDNYFVPDEFRDVAIARHTEVWGFPPATEMVDDRGWTHDPARAQRAHENFEKVRGELMKHAPPHLRGGA